MTTAARVEHDSMGPLDVPMTSVLGGPLQETGLASSDLLKFAAPIRAIA